MREWKIFASFVVIFALAYYLPLANPAQAGASRSTQPPNSPFSAKKRTIEGEVPECTSWHLSCNLA
jgi:hypothetical protein